MSVTISGSGQIIKQVVTTYTDAVAAYNNAWTTVLTVTITPANSANKVILTGNLCLSATAGASQPMFRVLRNGSLISGLVGAASGSKTQATGNSGRIGGNGATTSGYTVVDSPATTSAVTYTVAIWDGNTIYLNRPESDDDASYTVRGVSTLTAMEVAYA